MTKNILASKTMWVNLIAVAAALLSFWGMSIGVEEQGALVAAVMAIVNIALRLMTDSAITIKKGD